MHKGSTWHQTGRMKDFGATRSLSFSNKAMNMDEGPKLSHHMLN